MTITFFTLLETTFFVYLKSDLVHNIDEKTQKFIQVTDTGETITAIAVSPDRHVYAVAVKTSNDPSICIYDSQTFRKKRKLLLPKGVLASF